MSSSAENFHAGLEVDNAYQMVSGSCISRPRVARGLAGLSEWILLKVECRKRVAHCARGEDARVGALMYVLKRVSGRRCGDVMSISHVRIQTSRSRGGLRTKREELQFQLPA